MDEEYIIPDVTEDECKILEDNDVEWFPDDICSETRDVVICGASEYERALVLLGRSEEW